MFVRHWDQYITQNRNSIWLAKLSKGDDDKLELSELKNALKGTGLESPIEPFGGVDHFDISASGLVFTAKDPDLDPALHTKTNIYLITSESFWYHTDQAAKEPTKVEIYGFEGASTSPVFSPNGKSVAFLSMKKDGYESDKNHVFYVPDIRRPSWVVHVFASEDGKGWDRSPSSITFSPDGKSTLYFVAEEHGRGCLFASEFIKGPGLSEPKMIIKGGAISNVQPLKNGDLFISSTSLIDSSLYSLLPIATQGDGQIYSLPDDTTTANSTTTTKYISSQTKNGAMFGLTRQQIDEVHWPGASEDTSIHAWVIKPSNFSPTEKYPLAYLIHGGPQGAWEDSWSTRWNPAVFAEQGYIVIAPNPTGSTGYGQAFTDAIQGQWGGLPYEDLVKGFEWIKDNLDYVDTDRAVALGGSYGGYMSELFPPQRNRHLLIYPIISNSY
jgi:dipeptidyl aminopeptidase/acylaminoacyl peptidase